MWTAAALGFALTVAMFYPGLMSVDSAVQYAQARGLRRLDDVHPPLMTLLWRASDGVIEGPGGLFGLFAAAWWGGLASLLAQYPWRRAAAVAGVLGVGLFPATFLMLGHVWKDVGMAAALLLATAAIHAHRRVALARWRWLAVLALLAACGFRHNALFAALPLLAWLCWPSMLAFALVSAVLALAPGALADAMRAERGQAWTAVALWDLAALSIAADRVLLPRDLATADLTVDELRRAYVPYANPPLFDLGKIQLSFYVPYSRSQTTNLQRAWRDAVREDPLGYLEHRAALARHLLFGFPPALPRELVYVPERRLLPGTALVLPPALTSNLVWRAFAWLRSTPLFAGATYLLLAVVACALAHRKPRRDTVLALAASAWANALPLLLISGSAEFRYLTWTALAAVLALALAVVNAPSDPTRARTAPA